MTVINTVTITGPNYTTPRDSAELGLRSYSLYLWHFPIFVLLQNHGPLRGAVLVAAEWIAAALAAEASYRLAPIPII